MQSNANPTDLVKESLKTRLLRVSRNILRMKEDEVGNIALSTLKNNPICNLGMIRRFSGTQKDPDPISSTMVGMAYKFPILCSKDWARGLPEAEREEYCGKMEKDKRRGNFVKCKISTVNFWLETAPPMGSDEKKIANTLHLQSTTMARNYYNINWKGGQLKIGPKILDRRMVKTRDPILEVPKQNRKAVISELLMPGLRLEHEEISEYYVKAFINQMGGVINDGIKLIDQSRLLYNAMDSRNRMLPVMKNMDPDLGENMNALYGHNWIIDGVRGTAPMGADGNYNLRRVCHALAYEFQFLGNAHRRVLADSVLEGGVSLRDVLKKACFSDSYEMRVVKSALGIPVKNESRLGDTVFFVANTKVKVTVMYNIERKVSWNSYLGWEDVEFCTSSLAKGSFKHNGTQVPQIVIEWTNLELLTRALADIANYCRVSWEFSTKDTKKEIMRDVEKMIYKEPWAFVGAERQNWVTWMNKMSKMNPVDIHKMLPSCFGRGNKSLKIVSEMQNSKVETSLHVLNPDMSMRSTITNKHIQKQDITQPPESPLPLAYTSKDTSFLKYLSPQLAIENTIQHHATRMNLISDIQERNWVNNNKHTSILIPSQHREAVSQTARRILTSMDLSNMPAIYTAFIYCWTHFDNISTVIMNQFTFKIRNLGEMDLLASRGMFSYDKQAESFNFFNKMLVSQVKNPDMLELANRGLGGYRLEPTGKHAAKTFQDGKDALKNKPDEARLIVSLNENSYQLVRDRTKGMRVTKSVKRHVSERIEHTRSSVMKDTEDFINRYKRQKKD